jgi:hypothetical protein
MDSENYGSAFVFVLIIFVIVVGAVVAWFDPQTAESIFTR